MSHLELVAIEKFAEKLKIDFPVLLHPKTFTDRLTNLQNEYTQKRIDLGVKEARFKFDKQANKEAANAK